MKTLVTYLSLSGNTRKVAETIYNEINGEKDIKELKDVVTLNGYNLVFIGFPIHGRGPAQKGTEFINCQCVDRDIAIFITHAANENNEATIGWIDQCKEAAAAANLRGVFNCQGELAEDVANALLKNDDPQVREWGSRREQTLGQPDESRLDKARAFTRDVFEQLEMQLAGHQYSIKE